MGSTFGRRGTTVADRIPASFSEADQELARALDALGDATNYADWIVEMASPHLGPQILELGAGHGTLTERLMDHGKVTATDLSPRCVETLNDRFGGHPDVDVMHADIDEAVAGRKYDTAVLVNVLEHIADDGAALRGLYQGLRPGGTIVLFVPAFEALYSEFDRLVGHYRRYRRGDLAAAVAEAGFDVVEARYVNCVGAVAWWVVARQLGRFPQNRRSVRTYDRVATPLVRRLESRWTPPFGQSVLCIGRRPAASGSA
ncbi:MAG: class I SAM-dependent methyltransferase [Acidimicrobiales bacterium]